MDDAVRVTVGHSVEHAQEHAPKGLLGEKRARRRQARPQDLEVGSIDVLKHEKVVVARREPIDHGGDRPVAAQERAGEDLAARYFDIRHHFDGDQRVGAQPVAREKHG